jgi:hypothetical protein
MDEYHEGGDMCSPDKEVCSYCSCVLCQVVQVDLTKPLSVPCLIGASHLFRQNRRLCSECTCIEILDLCNSLYCLGWSTTEPHLAISTEHKWPGDVSNCPLQFLKHVPTA